VGWDGNIAIVAVVDRVLTLGEIQSWQFRPRVVSGTKLFCHLGYDGVGDQADWSGTVGTGTNTGATQADHVPLGPTFGLDLNSPGSVDLEVPTNFGGEIIHWNENALARQHQYIMPGQPFMHPFRASQRAGVPNALAMLGIGR